MKSRILMYLFVFSVLLIIFQYVNSKHIIDEYEKDIKVFKSKIIAFKADVDTLENQKMELNYFSMDGNEEALTYFEKQGLNFSELEPTIIDGLLETNTYEGVDHPIVPFASMTDSKILINKVKILNHKWILANFSDGKYWGELFINYTVDKAGNIGYTRRDYFLYPVN